MANLADGQIYGTRAPGRLGRARSRRIVAAAALIVAFMLAIIDSVAIVPASAQAATVTWASSSRSFSPNGDGQEDQLDLAVLLSSAANATVVILDSSGKVIRSAVVGQSLPAGYNYLSAWDGRADDGQIVADARYTARVSVVDAADQTSTAVLPIAVDTRVPGVLTAPVAGGSLSGVVDFVVTPSPGVVVSQVYFSLSGCSGTGWLPVGSDGLFHGSIDLSSCSAGAQQASATMSWTDEFGSSHSYSVAAVPVTVVDSQPPVVSLSGPSTVVLSSPGQIAPVYLQISCSDMSGLPSLVGVLTAANGSVVRGAAPIVCSPYYWYGSNFGYGYFNWDGVDDAGVRVADGAYLFTVTATDAGGLTTTATQALHVDTRVPGVLTVPVAGGTLAGVAPIVFEPTAGSTPPTQISLNIGGRPVTIYNASPDGKWRTTLPVGTFPAGPTMLYWTAYWFGADGTNHAYSDSYQVAINPTQIPLTATLDAAVGQVPFVTTLTIDSSDPNGQPLSVRVNWGDGTPPASVQSTSPYPQTVLPHSFATPGSYNVFVSVSNGVGGYSSTTLVAVAKGTPNRPPVVSATFPSTNGPAPHDLAVDLTASDPDGQPLTYTADFGDGTPAAQGTYSAALTLTHLLTLPGTYLVRLSVSDGSLTAVTTQLITVVLPEPVLANAGDDQAGTVGQAVTFSSAASRPAALITSYNWDFGDGSTSTSANPVHTYTSVGTYRASLKVAVGTTTNVDTTQITIKPIPVVPGLHVSVTASGSPIGDANLMVILSDGSRLTATTGSDGVGLINGLSDGPISVYAWADGYRPEVGQAVQSAGTGSVTIALTSGAIAVASVTSHPMTISEIVAAGINPSDPANQNVYKFEASLGFEATPVTFSGYTSSSSGLIGMSAGGSSCVPQCVIGGYSVSASVRYVQGQPTITWMVIPGVASFLKEFFDVQMVVTSLASPAFTLDGGSAVLDVPAGLALAPTSRPQTATISMPVIAGGESRTARWVLRGDTEGMYDLNAHYVGTLQPIGVTVALDAKTATPLHVWGASALTMTIDAPTLAVKGDPYAVSVKLKNVADVPVYNASIELLNEGKENYIYQPRERLRQTTSAILPGQEFAAEYRLVPSFSGVLDLSRSVVKQAAGSAGLATTLQTHLPEQALTLTATGGLDSVDLTWDAAGPGTTEYAIYSTTAYGVDFGNAPIVVVPAATTHVTLSGIPAGTGGVYAVSPLTDGVPKMVHSVAPATSTQGAAPSFVAPTPVDESLPFTFTVAAIDPDGEQVSLSVLGTEPDLNCASTDSPGLAPTLTCSPGPSFKGHVVRFLAQDTTYQLAATRSFCVARQLGDTNCDGKVRVAIIGDSYISGEGASDGITSALEENEGAKKYEPGTDRHPWAVLAEGTPNSNMCHRSQASWAYRTALRLASTSDILFAACSGAETKHVLKGGEPQWPNSQGCRSMN
jgi:PKD repeat protein/flagellar hook assembly protein FlgD